MAFKEDEAPANTIRGEDSSENWDEPEPSTERIPRIKQTEDAIPETLRSNQVLAAVSGTRDAISETLEEKVRRLLGELAEKDSQLEEKDRRIETLEKKSEKLEKLSIINKLTGLHTRSYFDDQMLKTVDEAIRYGKDFSLIFVDLDNFKLLNDKMGHPAGDKALKLVGKIIHETLRPSDVKCRYGGEEMVIILPEIDKLEASIAAERLRQAIESQLKPHLRELYGNSANAHMCTASIGVTSYLDGGTRNEKNEKELTEALIQEADSAMYEAKAAGRNTVWVYGEEVPSKHTRGKILDVTEDKKEMKRHATSIKEITEKTIPKLMRVMALREAADQIEKEERLKEERI